ncbi:hypothetical protein I302_100806 [Kwoniella bestiolae CBS 10118]|uniref:Uncharacterized protein n=1 Tax=Kwoniella bestiolae CBS 10118 TaxID=1296100 RepID=A0A1B9G662_9TREE|nr:hypothetical protein I302_04179 [Kwoniella bestiolae CBS 10118]OCF26493.1 hypothetical protein I302_04179 [Kwoniella bestiolae CBS 10118]
MFPAIPTYNMHLPTALSVLFLISASASAAPPPNLYLSARSGSDGAFRLKLASNTSHCLDDKFASDGTRQVYLRKEHCDEGAGTWAFNTAFPGSLTLFEPSNTYALEPEPGPDGPMEDGRKVRLMQPDRGILGQKWIMDDQGRLSVGDPMSTPKLCLSANEDAQPFEDVHLQVCGSGEEDLNSPMKQKWTLDYKIE